MVVSGPSNCGKTFSVKSVIENAFVYIYSCWQPSYNHSIQIRDINFEKGLPESLCDDVLLPPYENISLIIDDLMNDTSNNFEVQNVFTK